MHAAPIRTVLLIIDALMALALTGLTVAALYAGLFDNADVQYGGIFLLVAAAFLVPVALLAWAALLTGFYRWQHWPIVQTVFLIMMLGFVIFSVVVSR